MELVKKIDQDLIDAMKNHEKLRLTVIREIKALESYLPEQLSKEEILEIIDKVFAVVLPEKPSDMGKVMKEVTPLLKGKADMKEVSEIIKNKLS